VGHWEHHADANAGLLLTAHGFSYSLGVNSRDSGSLLCMCINGHCITSQFGNVARRWTACAIEVKITPNHDSARLKTNL
jgi:hypothetical protein